MPVTAPSIKNVDSSFLTAQVRQWAQRFENKQAAAPVSWVQIGGLALTSVHKRNLEELEQMDDELMQAFGLLLKQEFRFLAENCFQPVAQATFGTAYDLIEGPAMQFLLLPGHWVLSSRLAGAVYVYDSGNPENVPNSFTATKQLRELYGNHGYEVRSPQQQTGGVQCGDFAAATAFDVCSVFAGNMDAGQLSQKIDQANLRQWVLDCIQNRKLVRAPRFVPQS